MLPLPLYQPPLCLLRLPAAVAAPATNAGNECHRLHRHLPLLLPLRHHPLRQRGRPKAGGRVGLPIPHRASHVHVAPVHLGARREGWGGRREWEAGLGILDTSAAHTMECNGVERAATAHTMEWMEWKEQQQRTPSLRPMDRGGNRRVGGWEAGRSQRTPSLMNCLRKRAAVMLPPKRVPAQRRGGEGGCGGITSCAGG